MAKKSDVEKFNNMSKAERRVAVAKDVIKQINSGLFTPSSCYFDPKKKCVSDVFEEDLPNTPCYVCGIGAAAIAKTMKFNNYDFDNRFRNYSFGQGDCHNALVDCFTNSQLHTIERWFEGDDFYDLPDDWLEKSKEDRMLCIYQSIIDNKGEVLPDTFNDYEVAE